MPTATSVRIAQEIPDRPALVLAFDLGVKHWTRGCTPGAAQRPRERHVPARPLEAGPEAIRRATPRVGWPAAARVISGDEAGRDGFWRHRG